ncbi:hypothetical protein PZ739_05850 [Pseudomonas kermanshahensis]|uniref:hypothetical protein n=1 Tax=Pseudomonas kermanshahensis TaxID=2745482 RepID=UPI0023DCA0F6|nr:hypothetical protein [Pseudomonas kermanshahensis]WEL56691.1 hypothetical protein PZ739_05850 [Pseudomonas kermanshahensis]
MQPHQQVLALGILWLATLVVMPFLFATARRRAHALGFMEGREIKDVAHAHRIGQLERDLADKQAELDTARKAFTAHMEARRETIAELEDRIMSYTGLAVTKADYQALISACETLEIAGRTWKQLKGAEAWVARTEHQGRSLRELAGRVRNELRDPAASTFEREVAA